MTRWNASTRRPNATATAAPGLGCRPSSWPSKARPHPASPTASAAAAAPSRPGSPPTTAAGSPPCRIAPTPAAPILPRDQEARFLERLDAPPHPADGVCCLRGEDIRRILEQEFGARYSLDGVYKLLRRLGYSSLMPRPQHPDTDPQAQEFFKEIVLEQIEAIAEEHPGEEVRVWVHDEARFGQQGTITRVWARRGSRPRRLRQTGRESLYVLTAACPASGSACGLIMPELNTAVINQYLEQFSRQLAPGVRAVLLWDNAGYHVSRGLVVPSNVSLIGLLPYSPELNPVENLWHYLRSHYWSNRVFPDYESLREAAMEAWRKVCLDPEKIKTVCAAPYLEQRT